MKNKEKYILLIILLSQLVIKIILSTSPYSSFDEREFINYKNDPYTRVHRAFLLQYLSFLFPNLFVGRLFISLISSISLLFLPKIEKILFKKTNFLMTSIIAFNPLLLKLSSMYLTDSVFFLFVVCFFFLKLKRMEYQSSIIASISTLIRFEGFIIIGINLLDYLKRKMFNMFYFQVLLGVLMFPILLKGIELYTTSHLHIPNPEAPFYYYLITLFLINGSFSIFLPFAIVRYWRKMNLILLLIFLIFPSFYLTFHVGGTFSDRFRYLLPTILPSSYLISLQLKGKKRLLLFFLFLNLLVIAPLYQYMNFRETLKSLMEKII